jgi:hypothetical protein
VTKPLCSQEAAMAGTPDCASQIVHHRRHLWYKPHQQVSGGGTRNSAVQQSHTIWQRHASSTTAAATMSTYKLCHRSHQPGVIEQPSSGDGAHQAIDSSCLASIIKSRHSSSMSIEGRSAGSADQHLHTGGATQAATASEHCPTSHTLLTQELQHSLHLV